MDVIPEVPVRTLRHLKKTMEKPSETKIGREGRFFADASYQMG